MSSKADDFDVRYRDGQDGHAWGNGGNGANGADGGYDGNEHGVFGGTVDYDLGYDDNGWDTQGFRRPEDGYSDHETAQLSHGADTTTAPRRESGGGGSHARTASTQQAGPLTWTPDAPGAPF